MNLQITQKSRRWLVALLLVGLLTATSVYIPALTPTAYACQGQGSNGGC